MKLRLFLSIIVILSFVLPVYAWSLNTGGFSRIGEIHSPIGQSWYLLSRFFGLMALTAGCWQFFFGMARRFNNLPLVKPSTLRILHLALGIFCFFLFWAHAVCFVTAVSLRKGYFAYGLLLPNLDDYYHSVITVGWVALALITIAVFGRLLRGRYQRYWHRVVYLVLPIALLHSALVGSDTRDLLMQGYYLLIALVWVTGLWLAFGASKAAEKPKYA